MINIVDDYNPTNGDKIREMTDSELAQIIMCPQGMDPDICIADKKRLLRVLFRVFTATDSRRELN